MSNLIGFCGAKGVGKTTALHRFAAAFESPTLAFHYYDPYYVVNREIKTLLDDYTGSPFLACDKLIEAIDSDYDSHFAFDKLMRADLSHIIATMPHDIICVEISRDLQAQIIKELGGLNARILCPPEVTSRRLNRATSSYDDVGGHNIDCVIANSGSLTDLETECRALWEVFVSHQGMNKKDESIS